MTIPLALVRLVLSFVAAGLFALGIAALILWREQLAARLALPVDKRPARSSSLGWVGFLLLWGAVLVRSAF